MALPLLHFSYMRRVSSLVFALAIGAGSIGVLPCVCAKDSFGAVSTSLGDSSTCDDRYNAMIAGAKSALMRGDRIGSLRSLKAAKSQLYRCQDLEKDTTGATSLALDGPVAIACRS
jgi:hypothetical protein